jgi:DNA-directed RNA polymerase specialized sigma24 family protein
MRHVEVVYRVGRHAGADRTAALDLVQGTYLRAYARFSTHRVSNTRPWLIAICVNVATSRSDGP